MSAAAMGDEAAAAFAALEGIPKVDFPTNLQAALRGGRRMMSILAEVVALRRGAGKLTPNKYFYYRLWEPHLTRGDRRRFVGKQAQQPMHIACNNTGWYATGADKLLFHALMTDLGLPVPPLLAVTNPKRMTADAPILTRPADVERFLRAPENYPFFAKPIDGKYSLSVISADGFDAASDCVELRGQGPRPVPEVAAEIARRDAGYLIQRRLVPDRGLAAEFGPALWSVRALVLLTPDGPVLHRAVAKIATGNNPADNFWRAGNMVGAIDLATGCIRRVVSGTGAAMTVNPPHPDTGFSLLDTPIPEWNALQALAVAGAQTLPGIGTQSWDIALTDHGPVLLEVNFGGDLNLSQLASGAGVLDSGYVDHLRRCGYKGRV